MAHSGYKKPDYMRLFIIALGIISVLAILGSISGWLGQNQSLGFIGPLFAVIRGFVNWFLYLPAKIGILGFVFTITGLILGIIALIWLLISLPWIFAAVVKYLIDTLASLFGKLFCSDITINFNKEMVKFNDLKSQPENFQHRIYEYQIEHLIKSQYSTDKHTRILVVLTFIILIATIAMLIR